MSVNSDLNIQDYTADSSVRIKIIRTEKLDLQGVHLQRQDATVRSIYSRHTGGEWKGFSGRSSMETGKGKDLPSTEPMQAKQVFVFERSDGHPMYVIGRNLMQAKAELTQRGYEVVSNRHEVIQSEILEAFMDGEIVAAGKERADELIAKLVGYLESQLLNDVRYNEAESQLIEEPMSEKREKKILKAERTLAKRHEAARRQERVIKKEIKPIVSEIGDRLLESIHSLRDLEQDSDVCPLSDLESNLSQDLETTIQNMKKGTLGRKWKRVRTIIKYIESEKNAISGVLGCEKIYKHLDLVSCDLSNFYSVMRNAESEINELYEEAMNAKLALGALQDNRPEQQRKALAAEELSVRSTIAYVKSLKGQSLSEVESNPVVQTLARVIEFKKTRPEWHRNG